MQRAVNHRSTTLEGFRSRVRIHAKARERHWARFKERMPERLSEKRALAAKTAPLEEKKAAILEKQKNGLTESVDVVGIAAACSIAAFVMESKVAGVLFALGGAVTTAYGIKEFVSERRQLTRIRKEIASIR